jgi:membrane protease YdiL (CAAX protease family)
MIPCGRPAAPVKPVKLLAAVLLGFYAYAAIVGGLRVLTADWSRVHSRLVAEIVPALVALVLGLAATRGFGLARPILRPLLAGAVAGLPAAVGLGIVVLLPGTDRTLAEGWPILALRVLLAQVLLEELLFRGVALQRLDTHLPPHAAAVLAAAAFGLCHLGNLFFRELTAERLIEVGVQVVVTSVLAIAPILLVRRSGGVLWGAFTWHALLDLTILFPHAADRPVAVIVGLVGALATVPAAWVAGRWVVSDPPLESSPR